MAKYPNCLLTLFALLFFDIWTSEGAVLVNYALAFNEVHQFGLNNFFNLESIGIAGKSLQTCIEGARPSAYKIILRLLW